ncbi:MAG: laccase domain-containing protein, partial [Gammaproteobacteria bacterium]|nr:laccase domain-containing protein [Gammaproteobacteria bacterium]
MLSDWIQPDWPAPDNIKAVSTTRLGGVSQSPWSEMNLGLHVGDDADCVLQNRARLREELGLKKEPLWLNQVHGVEVVQADKANGIVDADASFSCETNTPCVV